MCGVTGADWSFYGLYVEEHDEAQQSDTVLSKPGQIKVFSEQVMVSLRLFDKMGCLTTSTNAVLCFISCGSGQMCVMNGTRNQYCNSFTTVFNPTAVQQAGDHERLAKRREDANRNRLQLKTCLVFRSDRVSCRSVFPHWWFEALMVVMSSSG